jgi:hypothetical protein
MYAEDRKDEHLRLFDKVFVEGWLTGYNWLVPHTSNIAGNHDIESIMAWLDKYCRDSPLSDIQIGLIEVLTI